MSKALSVDLRTRVLAAVSQGASHRVTAARFGVSAASVSRWRALERGKGKLAPGPLGGDRRSGRIEKHHDLIHRLVSENPDIGTIELQAVLRGMGHEFGYGSLWRFFKRHKMTRKKRPATPASRIAPMS